MKKNNKELLNNLITWVLLSLIAIVTLCSCNVTRNVTTRSEFYQRGDTSVMIQTKTTETYDGTIKR